MSSDFRRQLDRAYDVKVIGTLEKKIKTTVLAVDAALVMNTPVDTGRARSNWIASLNAPSVAMVEPGQKPDTGAAVSSFKVTDTAYIANNLPYIRRLNEGHSKQRPAGFVEKAVQSGINVANKRFEQ